MELNAYIQLLRRWLWLIILAAVVAGSVSFIVSRTQPPRYRAAVTIQIGTYSSVVNPNSNMIDTAEQLSQTYVVVVKTYPILNAVVQKLQLPMSPESLAGLFETRTIAGTSLVQLTVTHTNPIVASDIATELANQLILNSPTNLTDEQKKQLTILQDEIGQTQKQLKDARDEIKVIESSLSSTGGQDQAILSARRNELITQITSYQSNLTNMLNTVTTLQQEGNINTIQIVEPARIPETPISVPITTNTLVAAAIGGVLAFGASFLIEYLNNSIRTPGEVTTLLNIPLIGTVAPFGNKRNYKGKLISWTQPRSAVAEAYRALRVNLLYRETDEQSQAMHRIYVVTSPGPSEGKSVTTANLAVTFAITGMKVLLIDADLRRPSQHNLFNASNTRGLTTLWGVVSSTVKSSTKDIHTSGTSVFDLIRHTPIPNLDLLSAGPSPANPAELLGSPEMRDVFQQILDRGNYDVVFFDTPPTLVVSDSSIVASMANAQTVMVFESGRTNRAAASRAVDQITSLSLPILGAILNRLDPRDVDAGYGGYYYGYSKYLEPTTNKEFTEKMS